MAAETMEIAHDGLTTPTAVRDSVGHRLEVCCLPRCDATRQLDQIGDSVFAKDANGDRRPIAPRTVTVSYTHLTLPTTERV